MIDKRMFDFELQYARIAEWLPDNCKIVEVGVADCASALFLAEQLVLLGKNFEMTLVDNLDYGRHEQLNTIITNVVKSGFSEYIKILPLDSLNASCKFPDGYLDFVYIDASHLYEETKADIRLWIRKVKDERILAGHDANSPEVNKAIHEVIPKEITYDNTNVAVPVLQIEDTTSGYGFWSLKRDWQIMRNYFK